MNFRIITVRKRIRSVSSGAQESSLPIRSLKSLYCEAKLLYGLLLDRMQLSVKNRRLDEGKGIYLFFPGTDFGHDGMWAEKGRESACRSLTAERNRIDYEDTAGFGKTGQDLCTQRCISEIYRRNIQTRQNDISGNIKMTDTDMSKMPGNDTEENKTEINDTEYLFFYSDESEEMQQETNGKRSYITRLS